MKKILSFMLVMMIMLAAIPAHADTFTAKGAFKLDLPDNWEVDTSENDEYSDPADQYFYLGYMVSEDAVIEMDIAYDDGYAGESLSQMSKSELADYQEALKDWLEDDGDYKATYVGLYEVGDYSIPFMVFKISSQRYGDSYYAETLSGGWCISFEYYMYYEDDQLTKAGLNELLDILSTFTPIL